jgi:signal transduction histidine kinase
VLLSWYLSLTIAGPILRLVEAAHAMRGGHGRAGAVPSSILRRRDEIGELAVALSASATALWTRMDAIERFAADVAHEIKNPLSSIRSAIDTLRRVEDPRQQLRLLAIIQDDVVRLDRLISDISDASRVDAELSRASVEPVDLAPLFRTLGEIAEATRAADDPHLSVDLPAGRVVVEAVEGRLVQVLRNLIGNAESFSPRAKPGRWSRLPWKTKGRVFRTAIWNTFSTGFIPNGRRVRNSASIRGLVCRSAARLSKLCAGASARKIAGVRMGEFSARGLWCGYRRVEQKKAAGTLLCQSA